MGLFVSTVSAIRKGLARTRQAIGGGLGSLLKGRTLDEELIDEIETRLISADVGVAGTAAIIDSLRAAHREGTVSRGEDVLEFLKQQLVARWEEEDRQLAVGWG